MDIDIDVQSTFDPLKVFKHWTRASVIKNNELTPHPCGVYPQVIPIDPFTELSAIPYNAANDLQYLKIDFLHLQVYDNFKSRKEIDDLLKIEPNWALLQDKSTWPKLFQLSKHGEMLASLKPSSIHELADCMALIRPGKKNFIGLYKKSPAEARKILYAKDETGYSFKKSHSLAYSFVVWLQLHLIEQGRL